MKRLDDLIPVCIKVGVSLFCLKQGKESSPRAKCVCIATPATRLILQCANPPPQFLKTCFSVLMRKSVYDVVYFRGTSTQRIEQYKPGRQTVLCVICEQLA